MPRKFKRKTVRPRSTRRVMRRAIRRKKPTAQLKGPFRLYNTLDPFRAKMTVKLTYTESVNLATGAAGIYGTEAIWRLNSVFDPNFSGGGHQPYGFDQVTPLYRRYKVNAALIEVLFSNPVEDGMIGACVIQPSGASYSITGKTIDKIKETPMGVTRTINDSGSQISRIRQYIPLYLLEGLSKSQWHNNLTDYGALVTANPALYPYVRIATASSLGTNGAVLYARVTIRYYVTFYDRITQASS